MTQREVASGGGNSFTKSEYSRIYAHAHWVGKPRDVLFLLYITSKVHHQFVIKL